MSKPVDNSTGPYRFFTACSTGKAEVVAAYLQSGVDPEARDKYTLTGLIWAARKGRIESAQVLLDHGANIDACDRRFKTALHHACSYSRVEFVKFIVGRGASLNLLDDYAMTPLDLAYANERRNEALVRWLQERGAEGHSTWVGFNRSRGLDVD